MTAVEKIIDYFKDNENIFNQAIEELDSWNGYLNDDRYYEMEMLNEFYNGTDPIELLQRAYYGYDADTTYTDTHGGEHRGEFNPNREYFTYNGYGNLVSTDYKDYSDHLDEYAINAMRTCRDQIYAIVEDETLMELFDELENETGENND